MNNKLKELIQPYWVEEQQGVYIPLIDKVLLKNNVPEMPYGDYMEYAKSNGVQIATKDELLQMYLQKDKINKILREHNGDMLDTWYGSSSEYGLYYEWLVNFGSGYCYYTSNHYSYVSRAVADLKSKKNNMKRCGHCGRTLPESEFYRNKTRRDGLDSYCKYCRKENSMKYTDAGQERHAKRMQEDPEYRKKILEYYREYNKKKRDDT